MMSQYKVTVKKTSELSENEWLDYSSSFNKVFEKEFIVSHFKTKYFGSELGYSVHGILLHDNVIVGGVTIIPRKYIFNGQEISIGLSCDAFILKEHRKNPLFLKEMLGSAIKLSDEAGVSKFISIANKTSYPYLKHFCGWKDIDKLDYYLLPLRASKLIGKYHFIDFFSYNFFKFIINASLSLSFLSKKRVNKKISIKRDKDFLKQRYPSGYTICQTSSSANFVYKIYNENNNIITAYLIDCFPMTQVNIALALKKIIKDTKGKIDVILFIGRIDYAPFFFTKVPDKYEPRKQPFIGLSLNTDSTKDLFSINSWEISLANFDNR